MTYESMESAGGLMKIEIWLAIEVKSQLTVIFPGFGGTSTEKQINVYN